MKTHIIKNISIAMALLAVSSTGLATSDLDSRIKQLETQINQVQTETAMGPHGLKTTSIHQEEDIRRWSVSLSPLYWHAKVGKTMFAYERQKTVDFPLKAGLPVQATIKEIDFSWDWGFQVGLGYRIPHDGWDIKGEYTWFRTNGSGSISAGINNAIIPLKGVPSIARDPSGTNKDSFRFCATATSDFNMQHRGLSFHIGRDYFTTRSLSARPHFGLKGASVNQEQITRYFGGEAKNIEEGQNDPKKLIGHYFGLEGHTVSVKNRCDFRGLGPMIGFGSKWDLGSGFGIFGGLRGALLLGSFDIKYEELYSLYRENSINLVATHRAFLPLAEMEIGLRYDQYFRSGLQHIGIALGFEEQYWWNQNQTLKVIEFEPLLQSKKSIQDVAFYGLTAKLQIDF